MKLFALLGFVGIGILMIMGYIGLVPFAYSNLPQTLEDAYPSDLVVTIAGGQMSVNEPQPYYINNTLPLLSGSSSPRYLVIFDGTDQLPDNLAQDSTYILVKDKYFIAPGQNNSQQIVPFATTSTTTIQKSTVVGIVEKFRPYFVPAVVGGGALMFILLTIFGTLFWVVFHLAYVLIPAFLIFLFGQLRASKMTYRQSYLVALYASIPIAILFYLLNFLSIQRIPYVYTLAVLIIAVANIVRGRDAT